MAQFKKGERQPGAKVFEPGQSGNPNGRPRKIPDLDHLLAEVLGEEVNQDGLTIAQQILQSLVTQAKKGNVRASEVLLERAYGKPKQDIEQKTVIYSVDVSLEEAKEIAKSIKEVV